jgi:hypothetical protein
MKGHRGIFAVLFVALTLLVVGLCAELHRTPPATFAARQAATAATERVTNPPMAPPQAEESGWAYQSLSAEEREVVDRGRDASRWEGVHGAFSQATSVNE